METSSPARNPNHPGEGDLQQRYQNVVVMRHGDRMDNFDENWTKTAARPWDPPLVDAGLARAFDTGRHLRASLDFPIHRVFVSPFLRCVQTAAQAVTALCSVDGAVIDPSKIKVAIEFGLCEMLNTEAIKPECAPPSGDFAFNIPELEALLPAGTVDHTVKRVYEEMPQWGESVAAARTRYTEIIKALADKYPAENLLLVSHGEGVGVSFSAFSVDKTVYEVQYCGHTELRRPARGGEFEVKGYNGIRYCSTRT
ncbi:unnamed protein product [Linum tenue]|uniref:Uncharacterized protein n=1 Tax=Linum tenue TaxID=586396 RepID=A0AAV0HMG9_9ROSI|nr:unnamed protein product [Linum tenue]